MHLPGHNFTSPGTKLDKRLNKDGTPKRWLKPVNWVDDATYNHDLAYTEQLLGQAGHSPSTFWSPWASAISGHFWAQLNTTYYITAVLYSHSDILTSTGIENGKVHCGSVARVYNFFGLLCSQTSFLHLQNPTIGPYMSH